MRQIELQKYTYFLIYQNLRAKFLQKLTKSVVWPLARLLGRWPAREPPSVPPEEGEGQSGCRDAARRVISQAEKSHADLAD